MPRTPGASARWHVVVLLRRDGQDDMTLTFDHSPITIGGSPNSDVVLGGPYVSRTHATLNVSGGRLIYRDQSINGSFLNGQRIREQAVKPTDVVVVPPSRMTFSLEVGSDQRTLLLAPDSMTYVDAKPPVRPDTGREVRVRLTRAPGELLGRTYTFERFKEGDVITVGRSADSDICLDLQSVSRRHASLTLLAGGRWEVRDLGSRNGVQVNGSPVEAIAVRDADKITFGPDVSAEFYTVGRGDPPVQPQPDSVDSSLPADSALELRQQRSTIDQSVVVIRIDGRIDGYNYADFRDRLNQAIDAGERRLILDFSACTFCDHVGLGVVLNAKAALDKRKGGVCLIGVNQMLREGISLLRLNTLLMIEPDEASGVKRLLRH
jgi:anti-anti-sigma factor